MPIKLAAVYLLLGGLWIVLSDRVLYLYGASREQITHLQTLKGWLFIFLSACLIYALARHYLASLASAQRALRQSEARFQSFMDHSPAIAFIKDAGGRYLFVNRRVARLHGLDVQWFAGKTDADVLPPDALERVRASDRAVLASNRPSESTARFKTPAGDELDWLMIKFPVAGPDGKRLIGGIAIDITDRVRAQEEARRAKEAAEASSRAKDQFLSVLSHELRTPLTPALLTASALQKNLSLPPDVRDDIAVIREQVELETRLIDDLLDIARINTGKLDLRPEPADAHTLLRQTARLIHAELLAKNLRIEWRLDAAAHHIHADPKRLQQCLWNLLGNAAKFSPDGGAITVKTYNAHAGPRRTGQGTSQYQPASPASPPSSPAPDLVVEVSDTGIGIHPDLLPRLFSAFQQADQTLTRRFGGLGLGLSICKAIVDLHGGNISASSPGPGQGATFTLSLPAIPAPAPAPAQTAPTLFPARAADADDDAGRAIEEIQAPPAASGPARAAPRRILLVEDEPITQAVLARLLRTLGHSVSTASSVSQAVLTAGQHDFDLLIADIGLPDGSGWDLLRQLGDRRPPRAIALSGYGAQQDLQASREAGFDAHLIKPIDLPQLQQALHDLAPRA